MTSFIEKSIVCGASVIGKAHIDTKNGNQDHCIAKKYSIGSVLCVCDGVGSDRYSASGSKAACKAVRKAFKLYYKKRILKEQVGTTIENYYFRYVRKKHRVAAGTTCLFCFVYKDSEILVGQAGDGVILIKIDNGMITFYDKNKSFLNEVYPLNCNRKYEAWNIKNLRVSPEQYCQLDILLASDGISDDVIPDKRKDFLNHFITVSQTDGNKGIRTILENWDAPGSVDDKTAVTFSWRR